ncbi:hypothetical protein [Puniceibacterium sp. IMCC21224]|uniref:hypothetical protein n=1 Tax=Puniceibacterium sp. IMCC21224 TaxID=1618204 RepID=UPI00064E03E8|nr:hypothetical protein [Puniceibacterium sp. IMCC21224]KMK66544.1 hypothetical protein IMCC21224_111396 [Puniceibacterium sp. IMCC21224]
MKVKAVSLVLICVAGPAIAQAPLSAIDWMDKQSAVPQLAPPAVPPATSEPPVAQSVLVPDVEVLPLDAPTPEAVGLLPSSVTGLPRSLWQGSQTDTLVQLIAAVDPAVPALSALLHTLMLAEADPPRGRRSGTPLLAARLDRLIDQGVIDPAEALVERAGAGTPALFSRWFDLSLLTDRPQPPCAALAARPSLSTDLATRIYCTARDGDWTIAATVLETGAALGTISARDADLLARFLDPALAEESAVPFPPARPTPLQFRLFQAIGEPLSTTALPRAFATVDLSGDTGWKAQLEAAERLARAGAISGNRLLGIYTRQRRAASGGIWDRVEALQRFDTAMTTGDPSAVGSALEKVWPQMRSAGLLVPFSQLYGARLLPLPLSGRAANIAPRVALLSEEYEAAAHRIGASAPELAFLSAVARGEVPVTQPDALQQQAIAAAFAADAAPPPEIAAQLTEGRLGEVILRAIALFSSGADGNPADLTDALATFRAVGLEDTARRAALQLVILQSEGVLR